ncbi:uncharacterized protein LOC108423451 isoform X1 [Pygocentrus nattereri]|uniref:uncharacterized protein LOC108423451 isoform X1 n=1 Tax=Pygocentrus nattereri TaxID=42514 RepID=UPI000814769B|nr:uncharacterized protein LOC108423451 isoform X1 [Pygocentrus nattereri]
MVRVPAMGKRTEPTLEAKRYVCARRDKSLLESRFINAVKGYGVFATAVIPEGSFIVEYRGVLREAGQCTPDPYAYYFIHNNTRYWYVGADCIDASVDDGSLGRLVNDDSNPNSRMKIISVSQVPHLCLFALCDIQPGEEITYDYGGYDLPWRRGTWLCTGSITKSEDDKEGEILLCDELLSAPETVEQMVCDQQQEACREVETSGITQQRACEEEEPSQTQKTEQEEQRICENDLHQMQLSLKNDNNEEVISRNEEPSEPQPTIQVTHEEQMEYEEQAVYSQSAEQKKEAFEEQQTCMEVEPCVKEQSHTESTEQTCENQLGSNDDFPPVKEELVCEGEQQTCDKDSSQTQPAVQMACEGEQQTCEKDSSQPAEQSSQNDQSSNPDVDDKEKVSSDEEFIPDSDTDSDANSDGEKPAIMPHQNHLVAQATKQNFCFVCGKAYNKIARHLKVHKQENFEIASAFKLRKSSKERKRILEVLRNRGNYQHNNMVLSRRTGLIKAIRTPKDNIDTQKFEYCMYCKGLFMRKELWRHIRRCTSNPDRDTPKGTKTKVLGLAAMAQCPHLQHLSEDVKKVLCGMHQDEVAQVVRNDEYVLRLAQDFFDKNSKAKERHVSVRDTVRCIGRFLIVLQKKSPIRNLAEAIKPLNFPKVIEAVKEIAEFNEETNCFALPGLARRIGLILRKYCIITAEKAFKVHDRRLIDLTTAFFKLFNDARPQFALGNRKCVTLVFGNPPLLPFVQDVRVLHCYLEKTSQHALKELIEKPTAQSYADLSKVTLAQILMFNRRHGEASQMTIKAFQERDKVQVPEDALTEFEKEFFKHYCRIEVKQIVEGQVAIILTPEMISALALLIEKREQCGVCDSNIFVFGQPKGSRYSYRGENALRICTKESGAVNPEQLRSTSFSRHIATLTQVLSLKNQELEKLAKFIGHDISVRKEYYRLPEATARLTKLCKLILAIEKGTAAELLRESLDDITLPDEIYESDSEDDFEKECEIFEQGRARLRTAAQNISKKLNARSAKTSETTCTGSTEPCEEGDTDSANKEAVEAESPVQVEKTLGEPRRQCIKKPWTIAERAAVMKHFKNHIYLGKLASVPECQRCLVLEQPVLSRRTTRNIKDFVRNAGKSLMKAKVAEAYSDKPVVLTPQIANPSGSNV